jgi:hypothetical protein
MLFAGYTAIGPDMAARTPTISSAGSRTAWPSHALQRGDRFDGATLTTLDGEPVVQAATVRVVTVFADQCAIAAQSVPQWNETAGVLRANAIPYAIAACGDRDKLATFNEIGGLTEAIQYGGECASFEEIAKLNGGIRHYVIDSDGSVIGAWQGTPAFEDAKQRLLDEILSVVEADPTWRPPLYDQ